MKERAANQALIISIPDSASGENKDEGPEEVPQSESEMVDLEPLDPKRIEKIAHDDQI